MQNLTQKKLLQRYTIENSQSFFLKKKGHYKNWITQDNTKICYQLTSNGKINIFTETTKVVHHLRIMRCSNCQKLNEHRETNFKWCAECAVLRISLISQNVQNQE